LHQVGDLFELNVKLRYQKVKFHDIKKQGTVYNLQPRLISWRR